MKEEISHIAGVILIIAMLPVFGCARTAPPSPSPASEPKPAPTTAPAPKADPLVQIIEGAKKEGVVVGRVTAELSPASQELQRAIKDKYGVDLRVDLPRGAAGSAQMLAQRIMEYKTGMAPAYDVLGLPSTYVPEAITSGAFEIVDWRPLIEKGSLPDFTPQDPRVRGAVFYKDGMIGLMYNPEKISKAEAPKTLSDLLDPKWQGRLGVADMTGRWVEWAFVLGKDKVFSFLRSVMKMKPLVGGLSALNNRYLVGEIDLAWTNMGEVGPNRAKGMPAAFQSLDFAYQNWNYMVVPKGAPHPNAAKLVAVFLNSLDGSRFITTNVKGQGRRDTPGTLEYEAYQEDLKRGLKVYDFTTYPGMLDFMASADFQNWEREIDQILKGAG